MKRVILASFAILLAFAGIASGDASESRTAYKEAVEPICKTNKEASKRILTGVEKMVKDDKLAQAGQRFSQGCEGAGNGAEGTRRRAPAAGRRGEAGQVAVGHQGRGVPDEDDRRQVQGRQQIEGLVPRGQV